MLTRENHRVPFLFQISTDVCIQAFSAAKCEGTPIGDFIDSAIFKVCAGRFKDSTQEALLGAHTVGLFLSVATTSPPQLRGIWRSLHHEIEQEPALWASKQLTVGQIEDGLIAKPWEIDEEALRNARPQFSAQTSIS